MCLLLGGITSAHAQEARPAAGESAASSPPAQADAKSTFEIYGFAMLDIGHDFKRSIPTGTTPCA